MSALDGFHAHLLEYGRSPKTADAYRDQLRLCEGERSLIARLSDDRLAPKTRHTIRAALLSWADYRGDEKLKLQVRRVRLPPAHRQKQKHPLTKEQWRRFLKVVEVDCPLRAHIYMMAARGFRCGDLLRLKRPEVVEALDTGVLMTRMKGRRMLSYPVGKIWRPALVVLGKEKGWRDLASLIAPGAAKPDSAARERIRRELSRCAESAGIKGKVNPHLLRHTYATHYYGECRDPVRLKDHMQWASIETAMGYVAESNRDVLEDIASGLFD